MKFESYTTAAGKTHPAFESPFASNTDAADAIVERGTHRTNEFACDLVNAVRRPSYTTRGPRRFSAAKAYWLHKLAMPPQPREERAPEATVDASGIRAILDCAAAKLKRPAIRISVPAMGCWVKVSRAGANSRNPGAVYVAAPEFGGAYYGKITGGGEFVAGRDCRPEVVEFVKTFAADPAGVAAAHGHRTGSCCFCNRELTDARSTAVGYGPVCAGHYGLPWGHEAPAPAPEAAAADSEVTWRWESALNGETVVRTAHIDHAMGRADQLAEVQAERRAYEADPSEETQRELDALSDALGAVLEAAR